MARKPPPGAAYSPPLYEKEDVAAIQALARGEASAHQQAHALKYIVEVVAGVHDLSFRPHSARETDFAEGRRFVGLQVTKLTKLNINKLRKTDVRDDGSREQPGT